MGKAPLTAAQREAKRLREKERRASKTDEDKAVEAEKTRRRRDSDEQRANQLQVMRRRREKLAQDRAKASLLQTGRDTNAARASSIQEKLHRPQHHLRIGVHKRKHAPSVAVGMRRKVSEALQPHDNGIPSLADLPLDGEESGVENFRYSLENGSSVRCAILRALLRIQLFPPHIMEHV